MIDKTFNFNQVPYGWTLCYISECNHKEDCMRYQVCQLAPKGVTKNPCVLPTVMQMDSCPHFHSIEVVRAAVGFRNIFSEVKEKRHAFMRAELAGYLGGVGTFCRYRNGERLLMPEQQERIKRMFRRYGYTGNVSVQVQYEDGTFWLTQKRMAELFGVEVPTINYHLKEVYHSGELSEEATIRKIRIVQQEGMSSFLIEK